MTDLNSRESRGRFYSGRPWRKLRAWKLGENPICEECLKRGFAVPAVHVDHIVPLAKDPTLALDSSNLQSLCKPCHTAKTNQEQTGRKAKHWSEERVGFDGVPLDPQHPWNRGDE
jgi:5-methylcytosine-specific restriction enzyme A